MLSRRPSLPPAHTFLRRATLRLHHRIDRTSVLAVLTQPGLRLSAYTSAMVALQQAYLPLDLLLSNSAHLCPATVPAYVPRSLLITRDLLALHASLTNPFPPVRLTGPKTEAAYLGIRYVVEGAQLGSRVIYGHLLEAFGVQLPQFASFWIPDPAIQTSWPAVLKSLSQLQSRSSVAAAATAARLTFRHMDLHLAPNPRKTP